LWRRHRGLVRLVWNIEVHVVILDDDELSNFLMTEALRAVENCRPVAFVRPSEALAHLAENRADVGLAIVDFDMPEMNGLEVIHAARAIEGLEHVPIIMVTSTDQRSLRRQALQQGATDFLSKPFDAIEVAARVRNLLLLNRALKSEADRAAELAAEVAKAVAIVEQREREIVTLLMKAAEHRDCETGHHVVRVAEYVRLIAEALGFGDARSRELSLASTMHDVGKLSVPDAILLKPGPLEPHERIRMQEHAAAGSRILSESGSELMKLAAEIAATHHEKWDGGGYPLGLKGEQIPLSGRIVAVADVFDALTSERPYKAAWPALKAREAILSEAGKHFDPQCVAAFITRWPDVLRIAEEATRTAHLVA
jgi:putative two-component system response regulator